MVHISAELQPAYILHESAFLPKPLSPRAWILLLLGEQI